MAEKVTAPRPDFLQHGGDSNMCWSMSRAMSIYAFLKSLEVNFNDLIGSDDDPATNPLSYMDYVITKLQICQGFLMAGMYLKLHVAPEQIEAFLSRLNAETRWRLANGQEVSAKSWLKKGGQNNTTDVRGMVLRGYSNTDATDKDGWARALGAFQDYATKSHWHPTNFNIRYPTVRSANPDYWVMRSDYGNNIRTTNTNDALMSDNELHMKNITALIIILT